MKNIMKWLLLYGIEIFFYFRATDLEFFFMLWGFIFLSLFLMNAFGRHSYSAESGTVNTNGSSGPMSIANALHGLQWGNIQKHGPAEKTGGLFDRMNLFYVVGFVINVILYLLMTPH